MKKTLIFVFLICLVSSLIANSIGVPVFITETGKKYHMQNCRTIKNSSNITSISVYDAIYRGYSNCKVCLCSW